jgi:hypothetical protein
VLNVCCQGATKPLKRDKMYLKCKQPGSALVIAVLSSVGLVQCAPAPAPTGRPACCCAGVVSCAATMPPGLQSPGLAARCICAMWLC